MTKNFSFTARVWLYKGKGAWHFISVPPETTHEIDDLFAHAKRGWGSLRVTVTIGKSSWKTSIFPDRKTDTYLLPLKKAFREKEQIDVDQNIAVTLSISD